MIFEMCTHVGARNIFFQEINHIKIITVLLDMTILKYLCVHLFDEF